MSLVGTLARTASRIGARFKKKSWMLGGSIPPDWPVQWWQLGWREPAHADFRTYPPVAACTTIISQDLSRIPLQHLRVEADGSRSPVLNKAPARIFRRPNRYQTKADWVLYMMRSLLTDGNAYCWAQRNDRFEVTALYPLHPRTVYPHIAEDGEVLYSIGSDATVDMAQLDRVTWLPQRDVLHIRGATPTHPLVGESPLVAAVYPTLSGMAINKHTAAFFHNMGRPSGILRHPGKLSEPAMARIKERFKQIAAGDQVGDIAVLSENMSWETLTMSAVDSEVAKMAKLSERQIFQIFRVPGFLGNDLEHSTLANVEEMMRFYLMSTLGAWENLLEESLTLFFGLPANERIAFDVDAALLRGDLKTRIEAYARGVQNAVYKPDEVRLRENLPPVEGGDTLYLQKQMEPIELRARAADAPEEPPGEPGLDTELNEEQLALFNAKATKALRVDDYAARRAA